MGWDYQEFSSPDGPQKAVYFLNSSNPRQGRGEVSALARDDGSVGLFYITPGTGSAAQTWFFERFGSPADAAHILSSPPGAQGPGEASVFPLNGAAAAFFLAPGTA